MSNLQKSNLLQKFYSIGSTSVHPNKDKAVKEL